MPIRPARDGDLDAVGRVHSLSRAHAYVGLVPAEALARVTPERQAEVWRERREQTAPPTALLVAEQDGELVGFAHAVGPAAGRVAELNAIHTLPERLGSGVGRALHDAALEELRAWDCAEVELWVLRGNERAQAFYRRHGWVHDGATARHDVGGVDVPILRYRLDLRSC